MSFDGSPSSGTVLDNTLYIQNRDELLSVKSSGAITLISNLPFTLYHSCMLALNETALGLFGGVNSGGTKDSMLIYNLSKYIYIFYYTHLCFPLSFWTVNQYNNKN